MSGHNIEHGFRSGGSARNSYNPSHSIKPITSSICASSGDNGNSLGSHARRRSWSESLKLRGSEEQASVEDRGTNGKAVSRHSPVGEPEDQDRGTAESDVDGYETSGWSDCETTSSSPSKNEQETLFRRIESQLSLTSRSRRSMLTTLMHEPYTEAIAKETISTVPASKQSHNITLREASLANSLVPDMQHQTPVVKASRSKAVSTTTSNTTPNQQPVLSPRTARRNMLYAEITESLRRNLLSERHHKSTATLAAPQKGHYATNEISRQSARSTPVFFHRKGAVIKFHNDFFNAGLHDYHERGW